jgi:hypothetical protein
LGSSVALAVVSWEGAHDLVEPAPSVGSRRHHPAASSIHEANDGSTLRPTTMKLMIDSEPSSSVITIFVTSVCIRGLEAADAPLDGSAKPSSHAVHATR